MTEQGNRIKTLKRHKENLQKTDSELSDLKGKLIGDIDNHRQFCEDIEKAREPIQKELKAIESLPTSKIGEIEEEYWVGYEEIVERNEELLGTYSAIRQDVEKLTSQIPSLDASFNSAANISGSAAVNVVSFLSNMNLDPIYNKKLEELELRDTIIEQIEFIKAKLQVIKPDILSDFDSVVKDWSSTSAQKYKPLLAIRSVIFYQLLDTVAKESDYSKTVWYRIPSNYLHLFSIDAQPVEEYLNKGVITKELNKRLKTNRKPLSENATIRKEKDDKWEITNGKKIYSIKKANQKLHIWTPDRRKRYCQVKFLILGYNDELNIPSSVKIIDDTATNLYEIFNKLSEYGKCGGSEFLVENTFRDTLSYFVTALKLRDQFFRSSP